MKSRRNFIIGLSIGAITPILPKFSWASSAPKAKAAESNFVGATQVVATITNGMRAVGIIQIDVGIYTTDVALKSRLANMRPVLQANFRSALQEFVNRYYTIGAVPDVVMLSNVLQRSTNALLAPQRGQVLIQAVIVR